MIRHHPRERTFAAVPAALAGCVDALGFLRLGGYLVSFMSGNSTRMVAGTLAVIARRATAGAVIGAVAYQSFGFEALRFAASVRAGRSPVRLSGRTRRACVLPSAKLRRWLLFVLLAVAACEAAPLRWQKAGTPDATQDEAECRAAARQEAIWRLPYGDGPPVFGYPKLSWLQWAQGIDNERSFLEQDLTVVCMRERGFERVRLAR